MILKYLEDKLEEKQNKRPWHWIREYCTYTKDE